jgi:hypothetical protein
MRLIHLVVGMALAGLFVPNGALANDQRWRADTHPGDDRLSAIGCSTATDDDNWTCVIVRCGDEGALVVHYDYSDGGILQPFTLSIDGEAFPVTPVTSGNASFANGLEGDTATIIDRLKRGSELRILISDIPLTPGFDLVPLRGSSRAIGQVENTCRASAAPMSEADLIRDAQGRVGLGDLDDTPDCWFMEANGTVETATRYGSSGTIDGFWMDDSEKGRSYVNVEPLAAGADLERRLATLDYLLADGRKIATGMNACGAAGRVRYLVSVTEVE